MDNELREAYTYMEDTNLTPEQVSIFEKLAFGLEKVEAERNELLDLCKRALEKCSFPVKAAILKEKLQIAITRYGGEG